MKPETQYAKSGSVSIAYQVMGDGEVDLVLVPGFVSQSCPGGHLLWRTCTHSPTARIRQAELSIRSGDA